MNILIVRIGRMGDIVMILPAIQKIKQQYPQATLYALTSEDGIRILPLVGINPQHLILYRHKIPHRFTDRFKIKRALSKLSFDHLFCFESKRKTIALLPSGALTLPHAQEIQHYTHRCLQLVDPQSIPHFPQMPGHPYLTSDSKRSSLLANQLHSFGISSQTTLIGIHPTYSGVSKWGRTSEKKHRLWKLSQFAELSIQLKQYAKKMNLDLRIVMDLRPEERAFGEKLVSMSQGSILLLPGSLCFQDYLAFIQRVNVLLVSNTGVMHLAAALNTPLVALFSDLHPDDCGPYMAQERCQILRAEDTEQPQAGLEAISVSDVFTSIQRLIQS